MVKVEGKERHNDHHETEATAVKTLTDFIVDRINQGRIEGMGIVNASSEKRRRMEGKGKVSASSVYSNQHETEVTVGGALTSFIVVHINQGRMGRKGKR